MVEEYITMIRFDLNAVWTVINLLILYFLVKKFLFKPVKKIIAARETEIEKQYEDAKVVTNEANDIKLKYEASMVEIETEKASIIREAKSKAGLERDNILTNAKEEADKIITQANLVAKKEQEKRMMQVQTQIADLVVTATAELVASKTNADEDRALYNQFIAKLGEKSE